MTSTTTVTTPVPKAPQDPPDGTRNTPPPNSQNNRLPIADEGSDDRSQLLHPSRDCVRVTPEEAEYIRKHDTTGEFKITELAISDSTVIADQAVPVQKQPKDDDDDVQFVAQIKAEPTAAPEDENEEEEENPPATPANPPHPKKIEDHSKDLSLHFSSMQTEQPVPIPKSEPSPKAPNPPSSPSKEAQDPPPNDANLPKADPEIIEDAPPSSDIPRYNKNRFIGALCELARVINQEKPKDDEVDYVKVIDNFIAGKPSQNEIQDKVIHYFGVLDHDIRGNEPEDKRFGDFLKQFPEDQCPRVEADELWEDNIDNERDYERELLRNEHGTMVSPIPIVPRYKYLYTDRKISKAELEAYIAAHPNGAVARSVLTHLEDAEVIDSDTNEKKIKPDDPAPPFRLKTWQGDTEGCDSKMIWGELDPAKPEDREEFEMLLATNNPFNFDEQEYEVTDADAIRVYGNNKTKWITIIHVYMAQQWWWVDANIGILHAMIDKVTFWAFNWHPPATEAKYEEAWKKIQGDYLKYADASDLTPEEREFLRIQTGQIVNPDGTVFGKPETHEDELKDKFVKPGTQLYPNFKDDRQAFRTDAKKQRAELMVYAYKHDFKDKKMSCAPHQVVMKRLREIREHFYLYESIADYIDNALKHYSSGRTAESIRDIYRAYYKAEVGIRNNAYHLYEDFKEEEKEFLARIHSVDKAYVQEFDSGQMVHTDEFEEHVQNIIRCAHDAKEMLQNFDSRTWDECIAAINVFLDNDVLDSEAKKIYVQYHIQLTARKEAMNPEIPPEKRKLNYDQDLFKDYMMQIFEHVASRKAEEFQSDELQAKINWFAEDFRKNIQIPGVPDQKKEEKSEKTAAPKNEEYSEIDFHLSSSSDDEQPAAPAKPTSIPKASSMRRNTTESAKKRKETVDEQAYHPPNQKRAPKGTYSAKRPEDKPLPAPARPPQTGGKRPQTAGKSPGKHPGKTARKTIQTPSQLNHSGKN